MPEVKSDPSARDPIDFDPHLFVSGTATAYPELYRETLKVWMDKTQDSDLSGEVLSLITPVKSMHFNRVCDLNCSNFGQSEMSRLAVEAFDNESVHGSKPKVWVQIARTNRVKKILANIKKGAAKEKSDEVDTEAIETVVEMEDGGALVKGPKPTGTVPKKTAPKKTNSKVVDGEVTDKGGRVLGPKHSLWECRKED